MKSESISRTQRLVSFRKRERDRAGVEVGMAQVKARQAESAKQSASRQVDEELSAIRETEHSQVWDTAELALANGCYQVAVEKMAEKDELFEQAKSVLTEKNEQLLKVHRRVKQMQALLDVLKARRAQKKDKREQQELDDLSVVKETQK